MKGMLKAVQRTPHALTSRVGMAKKSNDPEFDELERKFKSVEAGCEKMKKDSQVFRDAVLSLLISGDAFAASFTALFTPMATEPDLLANYPNVESTMKNIGQYRNLMEELKISLTPELDLIDSRVIVPSKELGEIMKKIRKTITKREHKLVDYDRHNNSLTKLRDKKEKSLTDEKNLFKYEQDFEAASEEYEHYNGALKTELPLFLDMSTRFIDPLFHSFYFMQLNVFYLMLEKIQTFVDGKYDLQRNDLDQIYDEAVGDIPERLESLQIVQRQVSTAKLMSQHGHTGLGRTPSSASGSTLGRRTSGLNKPPVAAPVRTPSSSSKFAPAPPLAPTVAAPPAYSPPPASAAAGAEDHYANAATKRAPPPPPPLKAKPSYAAEPKYVVALFDFEAQAAGDLGFLTGDRIELVERTGSVEDWWTGKLDGRQGVFPGNYVQEA